VAWVATAPQAGFARGVRGEVWGRADDVGDVVAVGLRASRRPGDGFSRSFGTGVRGRSPCKKKRFCVPERDAERSAMTDEGRSGKVRSTAARPERADPWNRAESSEGSGAKEGRAMRPEERAKQARERFVPRSFGARARQRAGHGGDAGGIEAPPRETAKSTRPENREGRRTRRRAEPSARDRRRARTGARMRRGPNLRPEGNPEGAERRRAKDRRKRTGADAGF